MRLFLLSVLFVACHGGALAQVNAKGTLQVGLGAAFGAHATHTTSELRYGNFALTHSDNGGAVTVTFPIEVQVGLANRFSLGACLEPGRYLDSAGTHPNALFLMAIAPRFYAVNKDHFALFFGLGLGLNYLRIADVRSGNQRFVDRYAGGYLRPGVGLLWYFGKVVGLNVGLDYTANTFKWKGRDPNDPTFGLVAYSASLKTSGVVFKIGLQAKF